MRTLLCLALLCCTGCYLGRAEAYQREGPTRGIAWSSDESEQLDG